VFRVVLYIMIPQIKIIAVNISWRRSPSLGTESAAGSGRNGRHPKSIEGVNPYVVAPPVQCDATFGKVKREEHENAANNNARIQSSGQDVVVSHPPTEVIATHEPLEECANHDPRRVVDAGRWWHLRGGREDKGKVNIAPSGMGEATSEEVGGDGEDSTSEDEVQERVVQ